jgi:putative endonuclease
MYYVYVLYSGSFNRFYIGSTKDIKNRLERHNAGHTPSNKAYGRWELVFSQSFNTLEEARKRELEIKRWKNSAFMIKALCIKL